MREQCGVMTPDLFNASGASEQCRNLALPGLDVCRLHYTREEPLDDVVLVLAAAVEKLAEIREELRTIRKWTEQNWRL